MTTPVRNNFLTGMAIVVVITLTILMATFVAGVPSGPSITYKSASTSDRTAPTIESNSSIGGGDIATILLSSQEQDDNWKAYVGNVSGTFVLEDSANYSIYEWALSTPTGEVYATRTSSAITWSNIMCANVTHVSQEEDNMGHTATFAPTDSINQTFDDNTLDHWGFYAGPKQIVADSCVYSINPWINDSAQPTADLFEEILLYDGSNLLYTSRIENNLIGYRNDSTQYDFQMLVAENATAGASRTDYYFYVELL
jgi:hypothetical protein